MFIPFASTLFLGIALAAPCYADLHENFENVSESLGDDADAYTYKALYNDGKVDVVECSLMSFIQTDCYVRSQPGMDTKPVGVIPAGTYVRVWGVTDNGWAAVYTSADGWKTPMIGYMNKLLLFNAPEVSDESPMTEPSSETISDSSDIPPELLALQHEEGQDQTETNVPANEETNVQEDSGGQSQGFQIETVQSETPGQNLEKAFDQIFG